MVQKKTTTQLKSLNNANKTTGKQTSKPNQPQRTANTKRPVKLNKNLTQRQVRSFKTVKPEKRVRRKYPFKTKISLRAVRKKQLFNIDTVAVNEALASKKWNYRNRELLISKAVTHVVKNKHFLVKKDKLVFKTSFSNKKAFSKKSFATPNFSYQKAAAQLSQNSQTITRTKLLWKSLLEQLKPILHNRKHMFSKARSWVKAKNTARYQAIRHSTVTKYNTKLQLTKSTLLNNKVNSREMMQLNLNKWSRLRNYLYAQRLYKKMQKKYRAILSVLTNSLSNHPSLKNNVQKNVMQQINQNTPEISEVQQSTSTPRHSSKNIAETAALQQLGAFEKAQTAKKTILLCKTAAVKTKQKQHPRSTSIVSTTHETQNVESQISGSRPRINVVSCAKLTEKEAAATIRRSLRWYNPRKQHILRQKSWWKPRVGRWYKLWKRYSSQNQKFKKLYTKGQWKQKRRLRRKKQVRHVSRFRKIAKLTWPREKTKPSERRIQKRRTLWRKRKANNRTFSKALYRNHAAILPVKGRLRHNLRLLQLKTKKIQADKLSAYCLTYKLRYRRWHSYRKETGVPAPRTWKTARQQRQRDALNLRLWRSGKKTKRYPDKAYRELEVLTGTPSSVGYRRVRRAHKVKFSTNRWWHLQAVPTPQKHPLAISRAHPTSFSQQRQYKNFLSQQHKFSNDSWRKLEATFNTNQNAQLDPENWTYKNIAEATANCTSTNQEFYNIWGNARKLVASSGKSAANIKRLFIQDSQNWLKERYAERLVRSWSKEQLKELSAALKYPANSNTNQLRTTLLTSLRRALFQTEPNWWAEETERRVTIFSNTTRTLSRANKLKNKRVSLGRLLQSYRSNTNQHSFAREINNGACEKNLLISVLKRLQAEEKQNIVKAVKTGVASQKPIQDKALTPVFQLWLAGASRYFKLPVEALSSQQHSIMQKNIVTNLELGRARFPGLARSKATFDAALRTFYRRTIYPQFRRTNKFRFKEARPLDYFSKMQYKAKFEVSSNIQQRRAYRKTLSKAAFVTARWRRLLLLQNSKKQKAKNLKTCDQGTTKRRFLSNPNVVLAKLNKTNNKEDAKLVNEVLLQQALNARINEIAITKVMKQVEKRKLPADQILPPWKRKKNKRTSLALKKLLPRPSERRVSTQWAVKRMGLRVSSSRQRVLTCPTTSSSGEILVKPTWVRRAQWVKTAGSLLRRSRKRFKLNAFQRAADQTKSWAQRQLEKKAWYVKKALQTTLKANTHVGHQLLQVTSNEWKQAPFLFRHVLQSKAKIVTNTLTPKQLIAIRAERFRVTKEYANATSRFFQKLTEWLVRKQTNDRTLTKKELKGLVHATYWSLRIYLAQDPFEKKLIARDNAGKLVTELKDEMQHAATLRQFSHQDILTTRYQLQPYRLHKGRSLLKGARDWLRAYFPRKYSLYLEDPDEYRKLALNPMQIFRAHPARGNPGVWKTDRIEGTLEKRHRRLAKLSAGSTTNNRFENMLITNKKTAAVVDQWTLKPTSIGAIAAPRTHFFKRNFSTHRVTLAPVNGLKIITNRISHQSRFNVTDTNPISVFTSITQQKTLKETSNNRELSGGTFKKKEFGLSRLSLSLTRLKSPRNQEYLDRKKETNTQEKILAWREQYAALKYQSMRERTKVVQQCWQRDTRMYTNVRNARANPGTAASQHSSRVKPSARLTQSKHLHFPANTEPKLAHGAQLRKASSRLNKIQFKKTLTLTRGAAKVNPKLLKKLQDEFSPRFLLRNYKWNLRNTKLSALLRERFTRKAGKLEKELRRRVSKFRLQRKVLSVSNKRQLRRFAKNSALEQRSQFFEQVPQTKSTSATESLSQINYIPTAARRREQFKQKSKQIIASEMSATANVHFDRRLEVWDKITKFRNKRFRVVKTWVENIKYKMNKKKWKFIPYQIFKQTRSRIRAIEWKEPDRHFFRAGWRNAFRFGPSGARWLEALMYRRSVYSTRRGTYRRYQYPREQKRLKWLQFFRRAVLNPSVETTYIKRRRWTRLRTANQRLQRSLFNLKNSSSARRFVRNKSKKTARNQSGFEHCLTGLGNRLDVTLLLLNIAPSPFWARELAPMGLLRINGKVIRAADHRLNPGDIIQWEWARIAHFKRYFQPASSDRVQRIKTHKGQPKPKKRGLTGSALIPLNFRYQHALRTAVYERLPRPEDLPPGNRLAPILLKWFWADSGRGK